MRASPSAIVFARLFKSLLLQVEIFLNSHLIVFIDVGLNGPLYYYISVKNSTLRKSLINYPSKRDN
jgi:hypothetical protein